MHQACHNIFLLFYLKFQTYTKVERRQLSWTPPSSFSNNYHSVVHNIWSLLLYHYHYIITIPPIYYHGCLDTLYMISLTLLLTQSPILKKGIFSVLSVPGRPVDWLFLCSNPMYRGLEWDPMDSEWLLSLTRCGQSVSQFPTSWHHKTCIVKDISEYMDRNIES